MAKAYASVRRNILTNINTFHFTHCLKLERLLLHVVRKKVKMSHKHRPISRQKSYVKK